MNTQYAAYDTGTHGLYGLPYCAGRRARAHASIYLLARPDDLVTRPLHENMVIARIFNPREFLLPRT